MLEKTYKGYSLCYIKHHILDEVYTLLSVKIRECAKCGADEYYTEEIIKWYDDYMATILKYIDEFVEKHNIVWLYPVKSGSLVNPICVNTQIWEYQNAIEKGKIHEYNTKYLDLYNACALSNYN